MGVGCWVAIWTSCGKIYAIRVISTKYMYGFKRLFEQDVKKPIDVMMYFFEDMAQYKVDMMLNLLLL